MAWILIGGYESDWGEGGNYIYSNKIYLDYEKACATALKASKKEKGNKFNRSDYYKRFHKNYENKKATDIWDFGVYEGYVYPFEIEIVD